jgi:hypothetical protein
MNINEARASLMDGNDDTEALLLLLADHAKLTQAVRDYLEWGAMTGSDRDYFHDRFADLINFKPSAIV